MLLPIASPCCLTDPSFSSAQKVQPNLPSGRLPSSCSFLQWSHGGTIPGPRTPARRSHHLNGNQRHVENGCQNQFSICFSPSLPKSFFSPVCKLPLTPKVYHLFYSPVRFQLLRGNWFFLQGPDSAVALLPLKLIYCLRKNCTTRRVAANRGAKIVSLSNELNLCHVAQFWNITGELHSFSPQYS